MLGETFARKLGDTVVTQDIDNLYSDFFIMEQTDMVIASRKKFTTQYARSTTQPHKILWVTKEICYNAAGEVLMIRTLSADQSLPSWSPEYPEVLHYINS